MKKKNILVIIIDSLRSDKFIGSLKTSHTPNIDKLIENGIYFCNTVSPSDGTLFSWAGIFSGKYSFRTGINLGRFSKVDKKMTTLFHLLKKMAMIFMDIYQKWLQKLVYFQILTMKMCFLINM